MSDGPEWFAPKRHGLGFSPVTWQGWALTIAYVAIAIATTHGFRHRPLVIGAIFVPVTLIYFVVAGKTTRGGWGWRWGSDD